MNSKNKLAFLRKVRAISKEDIEKVFGQGELLESYHLYKPTQEGEHNFQFVLSLDLYDAEQLFNFLDWSEMFRKVAFLENGPELLSALRGFNSLPYGAQLHYYQTIYQLAIDFLKEEDIDRKEENQRKLQDYMKHCESLNTN